MPFSNQSKVNLGTESSYTFPSFSGTNHSCRNAEHRRNNTVHRLASQAVFTRLAGIACRFSVSLTRNTSVSSARRWIDALRLSTN